MSLPPSFTNKKSRILAQLSIPAETYDDHSPKGSIDVGIRDLIDEINASEGWVTTSSCAGRVSVFLEGSKEKIGPGEADGEGGAGEDSVKERETTAGVGGKGGGGRWLFVSHDPISYDLKNGNLAAVLGMERLKGEDRGTRDAGGRRFVHFKFEPMILHILTASLAHAQAILSAALQAGFRESGALNLIPSGKEPATPMVAVRSMGLTLESLIGYFDEARVLCNVSESDLETLLEIGNLRFKENEKRIERFRELLAQSGGVERKRKEAEWEDADVRWERLRREGLERKLLKQNRISETSETVDVSGLDLLEENT